MPRFLFFLNKKICLFLAGDVVGQFCMFSSFNEATFMQNILSDSFKAMLQLKLGAGS
jgi:hypothetical protein